MARHDDGDRIALDRTSNRLRSHSPAAAAFGQLGGYLSVTGRHAVRNLCNELPYFMLERSGRRIHRWGLAEAWAFVCKVGLQPVAGYAEHLEFGIWRTVVLLPVLGGPPPVLEA